MKAPVALRLARASNLPTVWTNVLTGIVLAGGEATAPLTLFLLAAMTLFYAAGMYLNDAFDREVDARERPERPLPSGEIRLGTVRAAGFAMMAAALVLLLWAGHGLPGGTGWRAPAAGAALGLLILFYDWRHRDLAWSPLAMGGCRALVYGTAGFAVALLPPVALWLAAVVLFAYVVGLAHAARQETEGRVGVPWLLALLAAPLVYGPGALGTLAGAAIFTGFLLWTLAALWPLAPEGLVRGGLVRGGRLLTGRVDVPRAVSRLIAGISLIDALLLAAHGATGTAWLAVGGFALTLLFQRHVPGT